MPDQTTALIAWESNQPASIPSSASPSEIARRAVQLTERDVKSITLAFEAESYEMVSTFVWARAAASLKRQIASLGMEFVGEMLGRSDIDESSDPATSLGDYEAISLAEDLGMINTTEAMRLKHALVLVSHFADSDIAHDEQMNPEEAVGVLRACIASVLGSENVTPPIQFADLRLALETKSLQQSDPQVQSVIGSPYFFQKTTLSVLLSLIKTVEGAQLEHAIGNSRVLLPLIWPVLRKPERWRVGQAYAEMTSAGNRSAASGLKKILAAVHGFDYVPETLRSSTFSQAAHRVMEAHFGLNNFYNEPKPTRELAELGTTIPRPAFPVCMTAILCVWLGNRYGIAWDAQESAKSLLSNLRREQWEYYFNECLCSDKAILEKITYDEKPLVRWIELVRDFSINEMNLEQVAVQRLTTSNRATIMRVAKELRQQN